MKNIFSKNAEILSTALMAQSPKNKKVLAGSFEVLYCLGHITLVLSKAVKRQYELDTENGQVFNSLFIASASLVLPTDYGHPMKA